jgi:hypothetical protein
MAIGKLNLGRAPGANGLRPELFKAGGSALVHQLERDYGAVWPVCDGTDSSAPLRTQVFQTWQDAEVVTLHKKGSRSDPNNYRGVFLLDVAGKILATVVEKRIRQATSRWLSDSQNGFREKRSTSHSIHTLRRLQEAVRHADVKTYAVFVDFEKAFDSPPRAALLECLEWIGVPGDLLAVVRAIHEDPKGRVSGSKVWFDILRGIRQGCVLGPTLFIVLLEFAKRMSGIKDLGVKLRCAQRGKREALTIPDDLVGVRFTLDGGEYADDMFIVDTSAARINEALTKLQEVCGSIGLNISAAKTEWLYLHNPSQEELAECSNMRALPERKCCDQVHLNGRPLKHVSCFRYLGSIVSEDGDMAADTRSRVQQSEILLNKYKAVWESELSLHRKIRLLKSHVFPALLYAAEAGNHTQADLKMMEVFLNKCRRRILRIGRRDVEGLVIDNAELQRRCVLPTPLDLLSRRRLNFAAKTIMKPSSITARRMFWAEVDLSKTSGKKVGGRARSSYLNVIAQDFKYLTSGNSESPSGHPRDLDCLMALMSDSPTAVAKALKAMHPDTTKGSSIRLVNSRPKIHACEVASCHASFAERKELNRHVRRCHNQSEDGKVGEAGGPPGAGGGPPFHCSFCSRSFRTLGWLNRHIETNHGVAAPSKPNTPPTAVVGTTKVARRGRSTNTTVDISLPPPAAARPKEGAPTLVQIPVSSPGDGGVRSCKGSRQSRRLRERRGDSSGNPDSEQGVLQCFHSRNSGVFTLAAIEERTLTI